MRTIELTQGKVALVDDADWLMVNQHEWRARRSKHERTWYALANGHPKDGRRTTIYMHRLITGALPAIHVDHINGNGLDNRRANLRLCEPAANGRNRRKNRNGSSQFKGVNRRKDMGRWRASIGVNGKRLHLGTFGTEDEAASAYDRAAVEHFGDFARLNSQKETVPCTS
jgi:hypothetical protein